MNSLLAYLASSPPSNSKKAPFALHRITTNILSLVDNPNPMQVPLSLPPLSPLRLHYPSNDSYGWHFQYLTILGLTLATITFICGSLADITSSPQLFRLKNVLSGISTPLEVLSSILYWGLRSVRSSIPNYLLPSTHSNTRLTKPSSCPTGPPSTSSPTSDSTSYPLFSSPSISYSYRHPALPLSSPLSPPPRLSPLATGFGWNIAIRTTDGIHIHCLRNCTRCKERCCSRVVR